VRLLRALQAGLARRQGVGENPNMAELEPLNTEHSTPARVRAASPDASASRATPFFSIVVPTYRSEGVIATLLDSLVAQTEKDFELIISDGASPDATLTSVEAYRSRLPRLQVASRPDDGIYDAINKGIQISCGRWILVLGADDQLADSQVLAMLRPTLDACSEPLVYGDVRVIGSNAMVPDGARYGGRFTLARMLGQNICQQAVLYRRDLFERLGLFDTRYRLWADWHFALRAFNIVQTRWVDMVVALYAATGASSKSTDPVFQRDFARIIRQLLYERPVNATLLAALARHWYWNFRSGRAA